MLLMRENLFERIRIVCHFVIVSIHRQADNGQ